MNPDTPRVRRVAPTLDEFRDLQESVAEVAAGIEALGDMVAELAGDIDTALAIRDRHLVSLLEAVFGDVSVEAQPEPEPEPEDGEPDPLRGVPFEDEDEPTNGTSGWENEGGR